jgi:hypothetical protein
MNDSGNGFPREASLNDLLHDPIIVLMMASDGVRSDDIRALFRKMARKDDVQRGRVSARDKELFECCFTP